MLLKGSMEAAEISIMIDLGRTVVLKYVELARKYHPELLSQKEGEG